MRILAIAGVVLIVAIVALSVIFTDRRECLRHKLRLIPQTTIVGKSIIVTNMLMPVCVEYAD